MFNFIKQKGYPAGAPLWTAFGRLGIPIAVSIEVVHHSSKGSLVLVKSNLKGLTLEANSIREFMRIVQELITENIEQALGKKVCIDAFPLTVSVVPAD